ncbi:hypothetical protein IU450_36355 [Nocardia abscessus]|uniref:hypothetical protein n=1 Tax=Nocardia abscessus TaxID=120957 RepID=UPI001893547A|nr:hypothetical protein [Nocardia abscessus]MBF6341315.1 hypothetical protein [Nocardia abscessus]
MRATVGISAEQTVVRGVMLSSTAPQGTRPTVLREVEQPVEHSIAASVAAAIDALTADAGSDTDTDTEIDDVAVAYRTVAERRSIVSQLSSAAWRSASLVSIKTALLALLEDLPGLEKYGPLLVLEIVGYHTSYLVVGPNRDHILASDSWMSGVVDANAAGLAVDRIQPSLAAAGLRPDAVVLCGCSAGNPEVVSALRLGLGLPVIAAPDYANAAAYGAALVAAAPFRSAPATPVASDRRRTGRAILIGAAAAALLGGGAVAVVQERAESPANSEIGPAQAPVSAAQLIDPNPAAVPPAPAGEQVPVATPPAAEYTPQPYPEQAVPPPPAPQPAEAQEQFPVVPPVPPAPGPPPADQQPPSGHHRPTTTESPVPPVQPPSTAAAPDDTFLFPGESPPPPWNADPAVVQAWWDNHWKLKESWLHGR